MNTIYEAREIDFCYRLGNVMVQALTDVSFRIEQGRFYCLTGPSGSGKTTLLNLLGLIDSVQGGSLWFRGRSLGSLREPQKNRIRRRDIGFVFQTFNLFPALTVEENVAFFLHRQGLPRIERIERVNRALADVGLEQHRKRKPCELSGGQRQRIGVARALAKRPVVLIGDEPTANLDQSTGRRLLETLRAVHEDHGATVILSSHDPMVQDISPNHIALRDGRVVECS